MDEINVGSVVFYGQAQGVVTQVLSRDIVMVKMQDGSEYPLQRISLRAGSKPVGAVVSAIAGRPMTINRTTEGLTELARALAEAGIEEINIVRGKLISFRAAPMSLEEQVAEAKAKAAAEAEAKVREAWAKQNQTQEGM